MKALPLLIVLLTYFSTFAQDDPCLENIMKQKGSWKQFNTPQNSGPSEVPLQKKMMFACHEMIKGRYLPTGATMTWSAAYPPTDKNAPAATYYYTGGALQYYCKDDGGFSVAHETATGYDIIFNEFDYGELFDTVATGDRKEGFFSLRHGLPVEISNGIWAFPDKPEPLGFGRTGKNRLWLITYDGKLPWSWVSRKEFLLKRKRGVQMEKQKAIADAKESIQRVLEDRKQKEEEYRNDPTRLQKYLNGTWNGMKERADQWLPKVEEEYARAEEKLDEQLSAPEAELAKNAIVIPSQKNANDFSFTDVDEPFALILIKPNPAYFVKTTPRSVPQFITVSMTWDHENAVYVQVMKGLNEAMDLDFLKSLIGKTNATVPPVLKGNAYAPPVQGEGSGITEDYFPVAGKKNNGQ